MKFSDSNVHAVHDEVFQNQGYVQSETQVCHLAVCRTVPGLRKPLKARCEQGLGEYIRTSLIRTPNQGQCEVSVLERCPNKRVHYDDVTLRTPLTVLSVQQLNQAHTCLQTTSKVINAQYKDTVFQQRTTLYISGTDKLLF